MFHEDMNINLSPFAQEIQLPEGVYLPCDYPSVLGNFYNNQFYNLNESSIPRELDTVPSTIRDPPQPKPDNRTLRLMRD